MINEKLAIKYCKNDISQIENYDKAIADKTQTWHCHHRRETVMSRKELIEICEYDNRPACELIFLTTFEHHRLHNISENNPMFGKHHSAETRKKMSEAKKGKPKSAETRKKMSEANKGKNYWTKGTHWYNNGVKCIKAKTCPEGFFPGRLK